MSNLSSLDLLVEFLPHSRDEAVTQDEISSHLGVSKRSVRQLVQQARKKGYCVCSSPYAGYWLSTSTEDILETINILNSQAQTLNDTIYFMRKFLEE